VIKWRSGSSEGPANTSPAVTDGGTAPAPPSASSTDAAAQPAVTSPPTTAGPPSAEPVTPPVAGAAPTESAPPGKAEPGGTASAIDAQVAALRTTAEQQWARDQRDQAMATLASARKLNPRDAEVARLARGFVTQMAGRAASAATAARNASAPDTAGSPLAEGLNRQRQAITLDRAGKPDETVRAYGEAIDLFTKASAAAKLPAPTRGNTAPPPGPPPATVTTTEPAANTNAAAARGTTTPPPAAAPAGESASAGRGPTPPPSVQPSPVAPPPPPSPALPSTPANANAAGPASAGTTASAAATTVAAESAVRQVLQRYRNGYETLNAAAVQAVYPTMNAQRLQEVFKGYSSLKFDVVIDHIEITADGQTATVTGAITNAPVVKTGKAAPQRRRALFSLRKNGDGWLIRDVQQSN